jgi:DNA-binding MarR family transcriptional regulator
MNNHAPPETGFGFLLHEVARLMRRSFNNKARKLGLTQEQCRTFLYLARSEGMQQVELADMLEIKPITLARLLDKLENHGLIERRRDPGDRRAYRLYLTAKAHPMLETIWQMGREVRFEASRNIPDDDIEKLTQTLLLIKNNLLATDTQQYPEEDQNHA